MSTFTAGALTDEQADHLNELVQQINALLQIDGLAPISVVRGQTYTITVDLPESTGGGGGGGTSILTGNTTSTPSGSTSSGVSTETLNANTASGLRIQGNATTRQIDGLPASATQQGMVTTVDQTWKGTKTTDKYFNTYKLGVDGRIASTSLGGVPGSLAIAGTVSDGSTVTNSRGESKVISTDYSGTFMGTAQSDTNDSPFADGAYTAVVEASTFANDSSVESFIRLQHSLADISGLIKSNISKISSYHSALPTTGNHSYLFVTGHLVAVGGGPVSSGFPTEFGKFGVIDGSGLNLGTSGTPGISGTNLQVPLVKGGIVTGWGNISLSSIVSGGGGLTSIDSSTATTLTGYVKGNGTVLSAVTTIPWADISGEPTTLAGYGITDAQPLDADLTSLASATGTNTIYYRSTADTWTAVTIGDNLTFTGGTLAADGSGDALTADSLSQFAATTSAELAVVISDETGTGALVFANSPALAGTPTAPTAAGGTNTTQLATTAFVRAEVAALVAGSPGLLDTLDELAAALGDDPNFATTITTALAGKQPLEATLTGIAATAPTADTIIYAIGNDVFATTPLTSFARSIMDDADAIAVRATIGVPAGSGTSTGTNTGDQDLSSYATTAAVAAGYQPLDSDLTAIAALSTTTFGRAFLALANAAALKAVLGAIDLSGAEATGVLAAARFPALTGDVTTTAGAVGTTIVANAVTTAKIANANVTFAKIQDFAGLSILGRPTNSSGAASEIVFGGARRFVASNAAGTAISARFIENADLPTPISATTGDASLGSGVSVTSSWANVAGLSLTLPGAGKYIISVTIAGTVAFDAGFYGTLNFRIRNTTAGTTIGPASVFIASGPNQNLYYQGVGTITIPVTVVGGHTIDVQGLRSGTSGINFLQSTFDAGSTLFYQRLSET
jgi:hypothetical protein